VARAAHERLHVGQQHVARQVDLPEPDTPVTATRRCSGTWRDALQVVQAGALQSQLQRMALFWHLFHRFPA
jgi:predicted Zn-dependent protease